jgi:hypothetical protein
MLSSREKKELETLHGSHRSFLYLDALRGLEHARARERKERESNAICAPLKGNFFARPVMLKLGIVLRA